MVRSNLYHLCWSSTVNQDPGFNQRVKHEHESSAKVGMRNSFEIPLKEQIQNSQNSRKKYLQDEVADNF